MKKILKALLIMLVLILVFSTSTQTYALSGIIDEGKDFIQEGQKEEIIDTGALQSLSGYLYNILLALGVVVAVVVATILGVQFTIGGAEGQAKVKETLVPFVIGCIIVFGGFGFWKAAITIGERLEEVETGTSTSTVSCEHKQSAIVGGGNMCGRCAHEIGNQYCDICGKRICEYCKALLE